MICSVPECEKNAIARGWCARHYDSWRYHGDPNSAKRGPRGEAVAWIKDHIDHRGDDCLIWPFYRRENGYAGSVWPDGIHGRQILAARFMCELAHGPAPSPCHESAHRCGRGDKGCIHPHHLRWATHQENMDDMKGHGTSLLGERNPSARLDAGKVRMIRKSTATLDDLAAKLNVSRGTVWDARTGKTWGHVQ
jgi:hypothetical protein